MRRFLALSFVLTTLYTVLPSSIAHAEENWRRRISAESATTAGEDVTEEVRFGREVAARMIGRFSLYDNPGLTKYVNLVGQALVLNTNRPEIQFHFAVLNTSEINAYAAPGGYVFVTRGAVENMQDESELAGVLAHEITHVNEKHVVKELHIRGSEGSVSSGLARLIGGGTESARIAFSQAVDKALDTLFKTGYKREDEVEADRGAVLLTALTGYDSAGLIRYFQRISATRGSQTRTLDRTHPAFETRIAWLKETIAKESIDTSGLKNFKGRFSNIRKSIR